MCLLVPPAEEPENPEGSEKVVNGNGLDHPRPSSSDIIIVSGKPENCEAAKQAMMVSEMEVFPL